VQQLGCMHDLCINCEQTLYCTNEVFDASANADVQLLVSNRTYALPSIGDCLPFRDFCLQCSILHQFLSYFNIIVFYMFYYHILSEMKQIRWEMVEIMFCV
jgi:hypothetical protein